MKNRPIQFRAWDRTEQRMIPWSNILLSWHMYEFNTGGLFWMQFTGLQDKHGKDIYEGDILRTNGVDGDQLWVVEYEMSSDVMGFDINHIGRKFSPVHNQVWDEGVVIGNIHEHKELIAKKPSLKRRSGKSMA